MTTTLFGCHGTVISRVIAPTASLFINERPVAISAGRSDRDVAAGFRTALPTRWRLDPSVSLRSKTPGGRSAWRDVEACQSGITTCSCKELPADSRSTGWSDRKSLPRVVTNKAAAGRFWCPPLPTLNRTLHQQERRIASGQMGATQTLADRTMEQRWGVRKLWERAMSPESPGGNSVTHAEAMVIFETVYEPEGYDQNVGRSCTTLEYVHRMTGGQKGVESRNFVRGLIAFVRGEQCRTDDVPA